MTNMDYFIDNLKDIYTEYGHCFVVLKNQRIINSYESFREAYDATIKTEELGTFQIQETGKDISAITHHLPWYVTGIPIAQ